MPSPLNCLQLLNIQTDTTQPSKQWTHVLRYVLLENTRTQCKAINQDFHGGQTTIIIGMELKS